MRAAVLDEVRPVVEVGVDRDVQFVGRHVHHLFAASERDLVVHLLGEEADLRLGKPGEGLRGGSAPPHDVAGEVRARAELLPGVDLLLDPLHGTQDAVAVPDGRHPVLEVELESLEDQLLVVRPVRRVLLDPPASPEGEGHVDVGVHEPGREELATPVDDLRALGDRHRRAWADGGDPVALDDDRPIGDGGTPVSVDDRRPDDGERWGDLLRRGRVRQGEEGQEGSRCKNRS